MCRQWRIYRTGLLDTVSSPFFEPPFATCLGDEEEITVSATSAGTASMLLLSQHPISMLGRRQRAARWPRRKPRPTRLPRRTQPLRIQDEPVHLPRPLCDARVVPPWPASRLRGYHSVLACRLDLHTVLLLVWFLCARA
jgi:hypothetical protein